MRDQEKNREPFSEGPTPTKMPVMIALFDVLGFSHRLRNDGIESIFSLYQEMVTSVIEKELMMCLGARDVGDGTQCPVLFSADIRYTYFSDTIMLWMPLERLLAGPFVQRCADLVCEALSMRVPLRGAIALGEAVMHKANGMYLGEPIIDAHELEEAQDWIGVAFTASGTWNPFIAELNPIQIIEYEIPVKEGKEALRAPLALDWPRRWRDTREEPLRDVLNQMNTSERHAKYYNNALAFADHSEKHHDWHKNPDGVNDFKYLRMVKKHEIAAQ
jgi:hypothetical protein